MLKCYIANKNLVNGSPREFDIAEGAVFTECFNETLDSGTIIIPQLTEEIEIAQYDVMVISSTSDSNVTITQKRMLVDTAQIIQTCLSPARYKYEITLFSETKALEGTLLPSLSITKLIGGTPRSVYHYISEYLEFYVEKLSVGNNGPQNPKYTLGHNIKDNSDTIQSRFSAIQCPELQWNEPTLREVLTDLMMTDDCIPVVQNNVINFIDLSPNSTPEISLAQKGGINYIHRSLSSADYVSEIKSRLVNSMGNETVRIQDNIGFRNYDTYLLTTENLRLETSMPIWNLKRVVMRQWMDGISLSYQTFDGTYYTTHNVTDVSMWVDTVLYQGNNANDVILEYSLWQTKDIYYGSTSGYTSLSTQYQNTCLYYVRGGKGIHNFEAKQDYKNLWINAQKSLVDILVNEMNNVKKLFIINKYFEDHPEIVDPINAEVNTTWGYTGQNYWQKCFFQVEYDAIGDHTFFASKSPIQKNRRQIVDNQSHSYINIKNQGMLEYLKANRLGNKVGLVNARYTTNENTIPQLAQAINGDVIFQKEISVHNNYIDVNYHTTANYILKDYFTGIKSKLRNWAILSGSEAFIRADVIKFYVNSSIPDYESGDYKIPSYSIKDNYLANFNYCVIRFNTLGALQYPNTNDIKFNNHNYGSNGYLMEFQKAVCGKSVLFTIKALDNAIVGKYISDTNYQFENNAYGMTQKNCRYVDGNGEFYGATLYFYKNFTTEIGTTDDQIALRCLLPAVRMDDTSPSGELTDLVAKIPVKIRKDNKEIFQITIQFELNGEANNIFLGKI